MFVAGLGADVDPDLVNEALVVAPAEIRAGGPVLPRQRPESPVCRLCGSTERSSREHIPPRSAGSDGRTRVHTITDWLDRASLDEIPGGRFEQGGTWGYTLCEACNSATGRLSGSYKRWAAAAARFFVHDLRPVDEMNRDRQSKVLSIGLRDTHPGAFVRQVMSLMFSISAEWDLRSQYPKLARSILDGTPTPFPDDLFLGMLLCAGPTAMTCGPTLHIDTSARTWRWISVLAFPPFAFELELARSDPPPRPTVACGIGGFFEVAEQTTASVDLDLVIAFTNTAFPADWRTRAQIENGLDLDGRPSASPRPADLS